LPPAIKASFLCYSQWNRKELLKLLNDRFVSASQRLDPTSDNFSAVLDEFVAEAKKYPENDYLLIQVFAGHGYHADGF
jgi:hypothetical protein